MKKTERFDIAQFIIRPVVTPKPEESEEFPWWLLILLFLAVSSSPGCYALFLLWKRRHESENMFEGDEELHSLAGEEAKPSGSQISENTDEPPPQADDPGASKLSNIFGLGKLSLAPDRISFFGLRPSVRPSVQPSVPEPSEPSPEDD
ncbi:hypothetical protein ElyMa_004647600 [Elysia marginata]|uniref:Uncharacterized protein n=1 Tax=Elysia marginata TaxID=1093978 RepID=A0AAV4I511_9GAST|nr:hypothetical protein ElyMa_004647600 [Elysia marginata]